MLHYDATMRTTVEIEPALLDQAKVEAARTGRRVSDLVQDGLRLLLSGQEDTPPLTDLPRYGGSGLVHGVDLENRDALLDLLDLLDER